MYRTHESCLILWNGLARAPWGSMPILKYPQSLSRFPVHCGLYPFPFSHPRTAWSLYGLAWASNKIAVSGLVK